MRVMSDQETIFSKILRNELPCHRLYEDEHVLAFLDINPISEGHTLLIPKQAVAQFHELSAPYAEAMGRALPPLCRAVLAATGADGYNLLQNNAAAAGQVVFHVHVHIIPRFVNNPQYAGLSVNWSPQPLSSNKASELVASIQSHL